MTPDIRVGVPGGEPGEPPLRPNERTISWSQLGTLVSTNLGTEIINPINQQSIFGEHGEGFEPESFDSVEVVWVQIAKGKKRLMIKDGHHRAKGVHDYLPTILEKHKNFQFRLRNMTATVFRNQKFDPPETRDEGIPFSDQPLEIEASYDEGPAALTPKQYVIALVPATKKQEELAPLRSASHLMQMWDSFVESEQIATKFSALAAFSFLDSSKVYRGLEGDLDNIGSYFETHQDDEFFLDSTSTERKQVQKGIIGMAGVLRGVDVQPRDAAEAAFTIIAGKTETIGGDAQAELQIAGLLFQPQIRSKIVAASPDTESQLAIINRLARTIRGILSEQGDNESYIQSQRRFIYNVLRDQRISINGIFQVLRGTEKGTHSREAIYENIVTSYNRELIKAAYLKEKKQAQLHPREQLLLQAMVRPDQLHVADHLTPSTVSNLVRIIDESAGILIAVDLFLDRHTTRGVPNPPDRQRVIDEIMKARAQLAQGNIASMPGNRVGLEFALRRAEATFAEHPSKTAPPPPTENNPNNGHRTERDKRKAVLFTGLGLVSKAAQVVQPEDLDEEDLEKLKEAQHIITIFIQQHNRQFPPTSGE